MSKIATKKSTKQLEKIIKAVGENGGQITTNDPMWWTLDIDIERIDDTHKDIQIGVCNKRNGELVFDPVFSLTITTENNHITETKINRYESQTSFGTFTVDDNDTLHDMGGSEKDVYGIKRRFSCFMNNMAESEPYLSSPKEIISYDVA